MQLAPLFCSTIQPETFKDLAFKFNIVNMCFISIRDNHNVIKRCMQRWWVSTFPIVSCVVTWTPQRIELYTSAWTGECSVCFDITTTAGRSMLVFRNPLNLWKAVAAVTVFICVLKMVLHRDEIRTSFSSYLGCASRAAFDLQCFLNRCYHILKTVLASTRPSLTETCCHCDVTATFLKGCVFIKFQQMS